MAIILDGKKLSEKILEDLRKKIKKSGKKLKLAAVLVGEDKNSKIFLRQKEKACKKVGVEFELYQFSENITQEDLEKKVKEISRQKNHGIIIQLPLPQHIDVQKILDLIPPEKDVDALSGKPFVLSPVLEGVLELLKEYKIDLKGKKVGVIGRGRLVGKPVAAWLLKQGIKVLENVEGADVIISGVGKPGFVINGNMIKEGAVVIDAAGDIDFDSAVKKASYITPTLGGVGPMTVAMVIKNLVILNNVYPTKFMG